MPLLTGFPTFGKRKPTGRTADMEEIWIIGAGYFGIHALRQLAGHGKQRHFLLADPLVENLEKGRGPRNTLVRTDGISFLNEHLYAGNEPDWIVPALPLHLAAEWCFAQIGEDHVRRVFLPPDADRFFSNPMRGKNGDIYVSHATFRCPESCEEPEAICTMTRKPRKQNMFDLLGQIRMPDFQSLVVRSHQLEAGVGGYRPAQLFDMRRHVRHATKNLLVSTSCRCHGVVTAMEKIKG